MKQLVYISEVPRGLSSASQINETEFLVAAESAKCFDAIFSPPWTKPESTLSKLFRILYFQFLALKFVRSFDSPSIFVIRPSVLTFFPLLIPKKHIVMLRMTDLISENIVTFGDENLLYKIMNPFIRMIHNRIVRRSSLLFCVTPEIATYYSVFNKSIKLVPNAVNTKRFTPRDVFQKRIHPSLVYVGVLKSYIHLNSIIEFLGSSLELSHVTLAVVGDGPKMKNLKDIAMRCHVKERVDFKGKVHYEDVRDHIISGDIGIALFTKKKIELTGTSSQKIYQYLSCGVPVICNYCPSHMFVMENNLGCLIRDIDSKEEFEKAVEYCLNLDREHIRNYSVTNSDYAQRISIISEAVNNFETIN